MTIAKALWFTKPKSATLQQQKLPDLPSGFCRVQTTYSNISPGTEKTVFGGQIPISMYKQMRCPYMEGEFSFPVKYGYSIVGKVISGTECLLGSTVHALHPHQNICDIATEHLHIVPKDIPDCRASLASNMETAVTAIWDGDVAIGDKILIVGFGIIGSLIARVASSIPGVSVDVYDICPKKQALARQIGFQVIDKPKVYDISFHCSASSSGLQTAIDSVNFEGRVIELSWYGTKNISVNLGTTFHSMRKRIICSQVSNIPSKKQKNWSYKKRKDLVFSLLKNPIFDSHITTKISFENLAQQFEDIENHTQNNLAYLVDYTSK
ncbi:zinc-binding alcohol dehydrogenase [Candidatus Uabimicrobium sp. HlEnr_7]|uniref:zinc-dependent alcohol dehydrogenase n=1 Tax=Candidatus Uabimicrobium helgolandensis TaxID=3095367 RepID=UPI0035591459